MNCIPLALATLYFTAMVQAGDTPLVPALPDTVSRYANGFLAHNYMTPGILFDDLQAGDEIRIVCSDGRVLRYTVQEKRSYQAVTLHWYTDEAGAWLDDTQLLQQMYNQPGTILLQTCIYRDGAQSWGRLFVIAGREWSHHDDLIQ